MCGPPCVCGGEVDRGVVSFGDVGMLGIVGGALLGSVLVAVGVDWSAVGRCWDTGDYRWDGSGCWALLECWA